MKSVLCACCLALLAITVIPFANAAPAETSKNTQKAVLVTGASSGIGRHIAERLAKDGHYVYAGARKAEDLKALNAIPNIEGLRLDVTKQDEIDAAVALVRKRGKGLYGLVNNAGVGGLGPLIEFDEDDMRFQMDINVMGPLLVTRAFAPLIIESKGRITTTGSISGFVTGTLYGPYSITKFAIEGFTDALTEEVKRFGVKVSVIEPGSFKSDISMSAINRRKQRGASNSESLYADDIKQAMAAPADRSNLPEPSAVAEAAMHALFDAHPKHRYMVVPNERQAEVTINAALTHVVELNQDQAYTYDRATLIKMLDVALDAVKPALKNP